MYMMAENLFRVHVVFQGVAKNGHPLVYLGAQRYFLQGDFNPREIDR